MPISVIPRRAGATPKSDIVCAGSGSGAVAGAIGVGEQMFDANEQVLGQEQSDQASGKLAKKRFPMLSWADFYRGLANEATLRAAQMANLPKRTNLKRLRRNGQRWRNGSSEGIDTPDARQ